MCLFATRGRNHIFFACLGFFLNSFCLSCVFCVFLPGYSSTIECTILSLCLGVFLCDFFAFFCVTFLKGYPSPRLQMLWVGVATRSRPTEGFRTAIVPCERLRQPGPSPPNPQASRKWTPWATPLSGLCSSASPNRSLLGRLGEAVVGIGALWGPDPFSSIKLAAYVGTLSTLNLSNAKNLCVMLT